MKATIHVYLHNFRGFDNTIFQLQDVNFFVGENSTGKTSVLAMLNVIFSPRFWFSQQFNSDEHDFGGFRDMLSASASLDNEFWIGLCQVHTSKEGECKRMGFIAAFREHEGLPLCSFFARYDGKNLTGIRSRQIDEYQFATGELPNENALPSISDIFDFLRKWRSGATNFKALSKKIPARFGLLPLMQIAAALAAEKPDSEIEFSNIEMPFSPHQVTWIAPIRTRPHRTYDGYGKEFSPEGEHTPYILRKRLASKEKAASFEKALKDFGKASGLFRKVSIHNLGKGAAAPFEVMVTLAAKALRIDSVGYGVSQVLPLLVEILERPHGASFAIQQPEVHLHPRAQAALGDLILQVSKHDRKSFLIETHSDFTIDRFRIGLRAEIEKRVEAQVLFFERAGEGNRVTMISILPNGDYSSNQPVGFREFFLKEQLNLLGL